MNNRKLPDERADLFNKAINALLQVDYGGEETDIRELSTDWKLFRDMAQHLALHMHQQGRDQGREIEEAELKAALRQETERFRVGYADALRDPDSRPVRWVSWHEAQAYCTWLNDVLAEAPVLDGSETVRLVREYGWCVALPSELEWEKAARGGLEHPVFSWGNTPDGNRANDAESGVGDTSVVGCFAANGFGLYDMIGNVWEWTRSLWGNNWDGPSFVYPYDPDDPNRETHDAGDEVLRVVRGGSWGIHRGGACCAYRDRNLPVSRGNNLGFRVVLRGAPVS